MQKGFLGESAGTFPGEHLGLRSIEASCIARGIEVAVINGQTANHRTLDETWAAIESAAAGGEPATVGFTGSSELFEEVEDLAGRVRARWPRAKVVLGHDFGTLNAREVLDRYPVIDFVIRGEGEQSYCDLAAALESGADLGGVPGLVYRRDGSRLASTGLHAPLDLDALPPPTRADVPPVLEMGLAAAAFASRGCAYRCNYCTTGALAGMLAGDGTHRYRSVTALADEIEALIRDYGVRHVTIIDDLFVSRQRSSRERARHFAQEIIDRGVDISLKFDCRVDSIEPELFGLLSQAGLREVFIGIESSSDSQLSYYNKTYDPAASSQEDFIRKQIAICHELDIKVSPGIITYHPHVTRDELLLTADLMDFCEYRASYPYWSTIMAYPGTQLYADYARDGLLTGEWPVPGWKFSDKRAERHYRSVKAAAAADPYDYETVRDTFRSELANWDLPL
ncbi:MAG TPA: radical SAM protein [Streptosporangiaceae bacterium]